MVLGLPIDAKAFDPTTFTKNRARLLEGKIADRFFAAVVGQAKLRRYLSSDHFSVDGTLLEAWASHKSFKPKDRAEDPSGPAGRNVEVDFRGEKRRRIRVVVATPRDGGGWNDQQAPAAADDSGDARQDLVAWSAVHRPAPGSCPLLGGDRSGATAWSRKPRTLGRPYAGMARP